MAGRKDECKERSECGRKEYRKEGRERRKKKRGKEM